MAGKLYIGISKQSAEGTNDTAAVARQGKAIYVGVGGVVRKVKSGYVGVGGVARQFWSGSEPISVTITGTGSSSTCYARINGTQHTEAASGIEVEPGDEITFTVADSQLGQNGSVIINGETVFTTSSSTKTYVWTVPEGIAFIRIALADRGLTTGATITVTTASASGAIPVVITGTGNKTYCYVTIGDTQYTEAASGIEVQVWDKIAYAISGNKNYTGSLMVDGASVATISGASASAKAKTGTWEVPEGTNSISIQLSVKTTTEIHGGSITITTT